MYAIDNDDLRGHEGPILCIAYDSDADLLITGSEDKTVRLWQLDSSVCAEDLQQADQERRQSEAPASMAAAAGAAAAPRRSLRSGADLSEPLTGHTDRVVALACCRDKVRRARARAESCLRKGVNVAFKTATAEGQRNRSSEELSNKARRSGHRREWHLWWIATNGLPVYVANKSCFFDLFNLRLQGKTEQEFCKQVWSGG